MGPQVKVVVDTNVVAYYLLGTEPFAKEAAAFWSTVTDAKAPCSWEAELSNVLWMAVRANVISVGDALEKLNYASRLGVESVPTASLWRGALVRAVQKTVAVYDTLFVELAVREKVPLVTFDGGVLKAFPSIAKRPGQIG